MQNYPTEEELCCVYVPTNHLYIGDILLVNSNDVIRPNLSVREGIGEILESKLRHRENPDLLSVLDVLLYSIQVYFWKATELFILILHLQRLLFRVECQCHRFYRLLINLRPQLTELQVYSFMQKTFSFCWVMMSVCLWSLFNIVVIFHLCLQKCIM